ncbi:hypothetical protein PG993_014423 [Apiospora rasikravindrae]|uniref:Uncharacterized protein n=1 Tax=Apiospora rasikravindrae TaxID=990691 RepID=A0ABR1RNU6_9PEZI
MQGSQILSLGGLMAYVPPAPPCSLQMRVTADMKQPRGSPRNHPDPNHSNSGWPNQNGLHPHHNDRDQDRDRDGHRHRHQDLHHHDVQEAVADGLPQADVDGDGVPVVLRAGLHRDGPDNQELRVPGRCAHDDSQFSLQRPGLVRTDWLQDAVSDRHGGVLR